jgi:predicted Zn-dependent peptidase
VKSEKTPIYTLHKTTLSNGLQVVGIRMPHLRSMVLAAFVRVGARCESEEDKGMSHFLEHIMLSGSRGYPTMAELFGAVESMGGTLNAASTYDHTVYWMRLHRDHLEQGVRVLADVLTRPLLDADTIEAERGTILNEMAGLDGESPLELMYEMIWPGRSAAFNVAGSLETVESFDRERLWSHYRRFYVPGNMVLCVVGRFEVEPTFALIAERLGELESQLAPALTSLGESQPGPRWISRPTGGTQVSFWLAQRAYPYTDPRRVQLHVLNTLLGVGTRSLLFERVREEAGLAYYIETDLLMESEFGILNIRCGLPAENLMCALEVVLGELRKLAEEPVDAGRLERAVELVRCQVEFQLDNAETMAMLFGLGTLQNRPLEPPLELARMVQAVTADEVMQVAREAFTPQRRYLLLLGPEGQMVRRRQVERLLAMGACG